MQVLVEVSGRVLLSRLRGNMTSQIGLPRIWNVTVRLSLFG